MRTCSLRSTRRLLGTGLLALLGTGCGDARFGVDLPARPKPTELRQAGPAVLRVPADQPFSIAVPQHTEKPGLDGTADADAQVTSAGTGTARAAVKESGLAEGLVQLGHSFQNSTELQSDFTFTVRFRGNLELHATPDSGFPDGTVGLKLYARDSHGRLLRDLTIVQQTTEGGATQRELNDNVQFTLTLAPAEAVSVFLAGQARAEIRAGRSAEAALSLQEVQIDVATRPAPPVTPP